MPRTPDAAVRVALAHAPYRKSSRSSATKRSGPTVYGVLERLEDRGRIVGSWEEQSADANTPRRRYYRLTPNGKAFAEQTVAQRRPEPYRRPRLQFNLVRGLLRAVLVEGAR